AVPTRLGGRGGIAARRPAAAPGGRRGRAALRPGPRRGAARRAAAETPADQMGRARLILPRDQDNVVLAVDGKEVRLTNLRKIFWNELKLTKGDLIQYYADVSDVLLPHIRNRAM